MLTTYEKSVYLIILNATVITRSFGQSFPAPDRVSKIKKFKKMVFFELEHLCARMEHDTLQTSDIRRSIEHVSTAAGVSFGQAQQGVNVLMKYHLFLHDAHNPVGFELDCPLDSVVFRELGERVSLSDLGRDQYIAIQEKIAGVSTRRIDFDRRWDEQQLKDEGLLARG